MFYTTIEELQKDYLSQNMSEEELADIILSPDHCSYDFYRSLSGEDEYAKAKNLIELWKKIDYEIY